MHKNRISIDDFDAKKQTILVFGPLKCRQILVSPITRCERNPVYSV